MASGFAAVKRRDERLFTALLCVMCLWRGWLCPVYPQPMASCRARSLLRTSHTHWKAGCQCTGACQHSMGICTCLQVSEFAAREFASMVWTFARSARAQVNAQELVNTAGSFALVPGMVLAREVASMAWAVAMSAAERVQCSGARHRCMSISLNYFLWGGWPIFLGSWAVKMKMGWVAPLPRVLGSLEEDGVVGPSSSSPGQPR